MPAGSASSSTPRVVTFSPICPEATVEPRRPQLVVQLGVDQVHLAQVGLSRVARDPRAVLDRLALVGVALDAQPGQEPDAVVTLFGHRVRLAAADRADDAAHRSDGDAGEAELVEQRSGLLVAGVRPLSEPAVELDERGQELRVRHAPTASAGPEVPGDLARHAAQHDVLALPALLALLGLAAIEDHVAGRGRKRRRKRDLEGLVTHERHDSADSMRYQDAHLAGRRGTVRS